MIRVIIATWVAGLVLVGCGDAVSPSPSASSTPAPATVDACGLVPDMDGIIGREALAAPSVVTIGQNARCTWVFGSNPSRDVSLTVGPATNHAATIDAFGGGEPIDGAGDDARWWPGNRVLSVAVGGRSVQVGIQLEPEALSRELAIVIAAEAIRRLP